MDPEDPPDSAVEILVTQGDEDEPGRLAAVIVQHPHAPLVVDCPGPRADLVTVHATDDGGDGFRMTLTDAAESYVQACRRILDEVDEAERVVSGEYRAPQGELTVTASM